MATYSWLWSSLTNYIYSWVQIIVQCNFNIIFYSYSSDVGFVFEIVYNWLSQLNL